MHIQNLEPNILDRLRDHVLNAGCAGPFSSAEILDEFFDIPGHEMDRALSTLATAGSIEHDPGTGRIALTEKGLRQIEESAFCHEVDQDHCRYIRPCP